MKRYVCNRCNGDLIFPSNWTDAGRPLPLCAAGHPLSEILDLRASFRKTLRYLCVRSVVASAVVASAAVFLMHRPVFESCLCAFDFIALFCCATGNLGLSVALYLGTRTVFRGGRLAESLGSRAVGRFTAVLLVGITYLAAGLVAAHFFC